MSLELLKKYNLSGKSDNGDTLQSVRPNAAGGEVVTVTGTSAIVTGSYLGVVRVFCTVKAYVNISKNSGAATTSHMRIAAEKEEYFTFGKNDKISFIKVSGESDGLATVTPCL